MLARRWPELPDRVEGPVAETALVAGWLRSRAGVDVDVGAGDLLPVATGANASDLLSEELDVFRRDPVYEAAARAAGLP